MDIHTICVYRPAQHLLGRLVNNECGSSCHVILYGMRHTMTAATRLMIVKILELRMLRRLTDITAMRYEGAERREN